MKIIVIANRGGLKVIKLISPLQGIEEGPREELLQSFNISEVEEHLSKKLTDQADRFRNWGSTAEKGKITLENENRAVKKLGKFIDALLKEYLPSNAQWNLAASSEINAALIEQLDPIFQASLHHNLKKDLMKSSLKEIAAHF